MHNEGVIALLFVIYSLLLGTLVKSFFQNSKLPYPVLLLFLGIVIAILERGHWISGGLFSMMINQVGDIDSNYIFTYSYL